MCVGGETIRDIGTSPTRGQHYTKGGGKVGWTTVPSTRNEATRDKGLCLTYQLGYPENRPAVCVVGSEKTAFHSLAGFFLSHDK